MDTPETLSPHTCTLCGGQLPRLDNGMQFFVVRDGQRAHVPPCPPSDEFPPPTGAMRVPVSQEGDGS